MPRMQQKKISLMNQLVKIKQIYGNVIQCSVSNNILECTMNITPSDASQTYIVKIKYKFGYAPSVSLLSPALQLRDGKRPHHLYRDDDEGNPVLCVYYPNYHEWSPSKFLADTFIPWISTWLNAYEYWLITGQWHYPEAPLKDKPQKTIKETVQV